MEGIIKIFLQSGELIASAPVRTGDNTRISLGTSPLSDLPLANFANEKDLKNLEPTHIVIIEKNNELFIMSPAKDNPPKTQDGKTILLGKLEPKQKIFFGNCFLICEPLVDNSASLFIMLIRKSTEIIAQIPLHKGSFRVGDKNSGADILLPFNSDNKIIMQLNIADEGILIEPLSNELLSGTTPISNKTVAELTEKYRFREFSICFVKNLNNLSDKKILSLEKILNILILLLFITAASLAAKIFILETANKKANQTQDPNKLSAEIYKALDAGDIFGASVLAASSTSPQTQKELVKLQSLNQSLSLYSFHQNIVSLTENNNFIRNILKSNNSTIIMGLYLNYLNNADNELKDAFKSIKTISAQLSGIYTPQFNALNDKISSLIEFFSKFTNLNEAWQNENWEEAVSILEGFTEKSEKAEMKELLSICRKRLSAAKAGQKIKSLNQNILDANFADDTTLIGKYKSLIAEIYQQLPENDPDFDADSYEMLKKEADNIIITLNSAERIINSFSLWTKNAENEEKLSNLVKEISKTPSQYISPLRKTILSITKNIQDKINSNIEKIGTEITLENLEKCDRFVSIANVMAFFSPEQDISALIEKRNKIYKGLLNNCDELYMQYKSAKNNSKDAQLILSEILQNSPADSRYRRWAENEIKNYQNNEHRKPFF